ncbi:MAG: hypothetical protein IH584_06560 [Candidatus Aminicenantes bacterium]|nr:hypothetical protein [Candidatus Aminicenantes bacterium]
MQASKTFFLGIILAAILIPCAASAGDLDENLKIIEPLLNKKWVGELKAPDGSAAWETVCQYQAVWNGKVVKFTRTTAERDSFEEGFIFWDDIAKKPAFFSIHSKAIFSNGFVAADKNVISFEGKMTWPAPPPNPDIKQSYDFKQTFEFISATEMVDKWFQNAFGPWRPGHVVNFKASVSNKDN